MLRSRAQPRQGGAVWGLVLTQGIQGSSYQGPGCVRIKPSTLTSLALGLITGPSALNYKRSHPTHPAMPPSVHSTNTHFISPSCAGPDTAWIGRGLEPQVGLREGGHFFLADRSRKPR